MTALPPSHEAARALFWQLATTCRRLQQQQEEPQNGGNNNDAVMLHSILSTILQCLYIIWSSDHHKPSPDNGYVEVLPWVITAWQLQIGSASGEDSSALRAQQQQQTSMIASLTTTVRILSLLAKQRDIKYAILQQTVVLVSLIVQTKARISSSGNACTSDNIVGEEKKSEEVSVKDDDGGGGELLLKAIFLFIKDLTLRAGVKDQAHLYEKLLDTVLQDGCRGCCKGQPQQQSAVTEAATAILWNWAVSLPGKMAMDCEIWYAVQRLWKMEQPETIQRNLAAVTGTMVAAACTIEKVDDEAVERVQEQAWLVPTLLKALQVDHAAGHYNSDNRRRCMRTLRCLAATDWGRSFLWNSAEHGQLGTVLVQILRSTGTDDDTDTRILACQTLCYILPCLPADMVPLGPCLETTLIQIMEDADENVDFTASDKLVLAASQALVVSLKTSPWKRGAGCCSAALFDQILAVLQEQVDQPAYHVGFSDLFLQLVAGESDDLVESTTTTRIKGISTLLVSFPAALEIMTILLSPLASGPDFDASRSNAVKVLTIIVNDNDCNKKPMADDENLLTALVNVCLMTSNEGQLKDDAKELILTLVPEL